MGGKPSSYRPGADCVAQEINSISTGGKKNGSQLWTESPWLVTAHRSLGSSGHASKQQAGIPSVSHFGLAPVVSSVTIQSQQPPSAA